jgi:hypothetical protein
MNERERFSWTEDVPGRQIVRCGGGSFEIKPGEAGGMLQRTSVVEDAGRGGKGLRLGAHSTDARNHRMDDRIGRQVRQTLRGGRIWRTSVGPELSQ